MLWGKSRTGSEFIRDCIVNHGMKNLAIIGPASKDVRNIMVNGPSGIMSVFPPNGEIQPHYSMGKGIVEFNNGAVVNCFSTEATPDSIRGGNYQAIWGDEIVAWKDADEFFNQSMFTLRMDPSRMLLTTTGKAIPVLLNLLKREGKDVKIIRGNTMDNRMNLSKAFINQLEEVYQGTRLGKQEMGSEILLENDGALWKMNTIMRNSIHEDELPPFELIVISVDPAVTHGTKKNDETGIVVAGVDSDGVSYILGDYTKHMTPEEWSGRVVALYDQYSEQSRVDVLVERNQGGDMITDVLIRRRRNLPVKTIFATASKYDRGVAPGLKGEQGKIKFVKEAKLEPLQDELVSYDGSQRRSPNRFDSFNMAIHHLAPVKKSFTYSEEFLI